MKLTDIRDMLCEILPGAVFHYKPDINKRNKYIVWAEDNQSGASYADNKTKAITLQGTIDFFTKTEFDETTKAIQKAMDNLKLVWKANGTQYENETGYIHHEWIWEMREAVG